MKSKISPYPTWVLLLVAAVSSRAASAGPMSNPAFMGISMGDSGQGCQIDKVTAGGAAADAGVRSFDTILAINGVALAGGHPCDALKTEILAHPPGDVVRLDILRGMDRVNLRVALTTRAEVLARRFVGHALPATELTDLDNSNKSYDLAEHRGRTQVIGWFMASRCSGCGKVFERISDGIEHRMKDASPQLLAVTQRGVREDPLLMRKTFTASVPLASADEETFADLAIDDPDRVHFMVIDCRGTVRFVAPIAPDADDLDAAVDDVLAAIEQAEHVRTQRR